MFGHGPWYANDPASLRSCFEPVGRSRLDTSPAPRASPVDLIVPIFRQINGPPHSAFIRRRILVVVDTADYESPALTD